MATHYKIRRSDGHFSRGGYWPTFSRKGKTWSSLAALNLHLTNVGQGGLGLVKAYAKCEVVVIEVEERVVSAVGVLDHEAARALSKRERAEAKAEALEARRAAELEADELRTYERLRKKFESL